MKKSLVLAMAMALGVTASAYAANPFSDVPAGHWAYDSIDKLAAAGVIDGMGDGTYQGDKTMTRYEMAQIVAKAMAKGANVDKLAAEFADELDNLGVRVANLEKKADNVKITGAISMNYSKGHANYAASNKSSEKMMLRSDITMKGQINEDWTYTALVRNDQYLNGTAKGVGEETPNFQRAWVDGRVGGLKVRAGRHQKSMGGNEIWNTRVDGIEVAYGKAVKVVAGYAQLADGSATNGADGKVLYAEASTKLGKRADIALGYYAFKDMTKLKGGVDGKAKTETTAAVAAAGYLAEDKDADNGIFSATLNYAVTKDVKLTGTYLHADGANKFRPALDAEKKPLFADKSDKDGFSVKLAYKGAKAAKAGSWGMYAKYVDLPAAVAMSNTYTTPAMVSSTYGMKGTIVGANYALAKNIVGTVEYYDMKLNDGPNEGKHQETLFAGVSFSF